MPYLIQVWFRKANETPVTVTGVGKPDKEAALLWAAYQVGLCYAKGWVITEIVLRDDFGNRVQIPQELYDLWAKVKN